MATVVDAAGQPRRSRVRHAGSERGARLARVLATMPVAVVETDAAGVITYANDAAGRILRIARAEIEGRAYDAPAWRISAPDGGPMAAEDLPVARALKGETVTGFEHAIEDPARAERVVLSVSAAPIRGRNGAIEGVTAVLVDITERHRARAALRASERRLRLAQEAGGVGLWDWDLVTGRVFWSEGYYHVWGLDPAEIVPSYEAFLAHIHLEDRPAAEEAVRAALAGERPLDAAEWRVPQRDGSVRWIATRGEVISDAAGRPVRLIGVCLNVTSRRRAEETAREGEARLRAVVESLPFDLWVCDREGRYVLQNSASRQNWGDRVGLRPEDTDTSPELLGRWLEDNRRALAGLTVRAEEELEVQGVGVRQVEKVLAPIEVDGRLAGYVGVNIDVTERKQAEAARRVSEERFRAVLTGSPVFVYEMGPDLRYRWVCNPPPPLAPEEWVGRRDDDTAPPEHAEPRLKLKRQVLETGISARAEVTHDLGDGEVHTYDLTLEPVRDGLGRVVGLRGAALDVTERKRAEAALRASEERLRLAVEATGLGIFDVDVASGARRWSEEFKAILGLPPDTRPDPALYDSLIHPEDRAWVNQRYWGIYRGEHGGVYDVEYRILRASDGAERWVHNRGRVFFDAQGRALRGIGTLLDMTARKEAEAALRESERRLDLAVRAHGIGVFDWHVPSGRVVWSEQEERIFGLEPGSFEGGIEGWASRVLPEDAESMRALMADAMARGEPGVDFVFRIRRPDGEVRDLEGSGSFLYAEDGKPQRMVGVNIDVTERKRAEAALRENEARLRLAQEAGRIGDWEWDFDTGAVRWSSTLYRVLGIDPARAPSAEAFFEMIHLDDRSAARQAAKAAIQGRAPLDIEFRVILPDGRVRWLASRGELVRDGTGRSRRLVGVNFDVTERRETEDRLRLHALLLESMAEGVSLSTDEGVIVYANPAEERMFGYGPGELIGLHVSAQNAYPPDENARIVAEVIATLRVEGVWRGEWLNRRKDGTEFLTWAHITAVEIGGRRHWLCVQADVTEQRRAEAALRESEARYRATQEHAQIGIGEVDAEGRFLRVNAAMCAMTGYPREELLGRTVFDVTHPVDATAERAEYARLVTGETGTYAREKRYVRRDGAERWVEVAATAVRDAQGRFLYGVRVVQDVTDRKLAQERQRLLLAELSHRVKNTLAVVQGIAVRSLAGDRTLDEARDAFTKRLRALARAHDLLTASEWRGASLLAVVEGELKPYSGRVTLDGPDLALSSKAAQTLALVLHELATNAAKHGALSAPEGRVEVEWATNPAANAPTLRLSWRERDGPPVRPPKRRGFGRTLIEQAPAYDLQGKGRLDFRPQGLAYDLEVPLAELCP